MQQRISSLCRKTIPRETLIAILDVSIQIQLKVKSIHANQRKKISQDRVSESVMAMPNRMRFQRFKVIVVGFLLNPNMNKIIKSGDHFLIFIVMFRSVFKNDLSLENLAGSWFCLSGIQNRYFLHSASSPGGCNLVPPRCPSGGW